MKKEEICTNIEYLRKILYEKLNKNNSNLKNKDVIYLGFVLNSMLNTYEKDYERKKKL